MNLFVTALVWVAYIVSLYFSIFLLLVFFDKKEVFKQEKSQTKLTREPFVSVLIPAYNEQDTILNTLQSVHELEYPREKMDVIVINDGSSDNTKEIIEEYIKDKPHFRLLSHENRGKAASMNRALELAKGEFFACLDADSFVERLTLRKMLAMYENEGEDVAIITPAMKVHQPKNILQRVQWLEYIVLIFIARIVSQIDSIYVAPGPFSLYRTHIIRNLGGFDEQNITEDQEIAYRVQKHNFRIKHSFDGYVYTTAPRKLKPFYKQRRRWYLGGMICLHQYKDMVADTKYGDFGVMQLVKNLIGYFLAVSGITIAIYIFFLPALRWLQDLIAIRFNIWPYLANINFDISIMDLLLTDLKLMYIVVFLFFVGFYFFYQAHKNAQEKMMKFGWFALIPYFFFYYLLKGIILLLSLFEFSRGRDVKW